MTDPIVQIIIGLALGTAFAVVSIGIINVLGWMGLV